MAGMSNAQDGDSEFGKNRVQYQDFTWSKYTTKNFEGYWHNGARFAGQSALQLAEMDYAEIQSLLEYRVSGKIKLIIYSDYKEFKQSNVGASEIFINTGGVTKIIGDKMFVYFDGNHRNLRKQIRQGLAGLYLRHMMFGGNLQEIVQNAVLFNLPPWFTEGLTAYVGESWSTQLDNQLKSQFIHKRIKNFRQLHKSDAQLAGHSMWFYLAHHYGRSTVSNLLYLTRINRSAESAFLYVLGQTYDQTTIDWYSFFNQRYQSNNIDTSATILKLKKKHRKYLAGFQISPAGDKILFALNIHGKIKVFQEDIRGGNRIQLFKVGSKNNLQATDPAYPIINYSPSGKLATVIYENHSKLFVTTINLETNKVLDNEEIPSRYQRILSASMNSSRELILTAVQGGKSDLFLFNLKTRSSKQLTNDYFDDYQGTAVDLDGYKGVLFSSNRGDSTSLKKSKIDSLLPLASFDLYFLELNEKEKRLHRLTFDGESDQQNPNQINSSEFIYQSNSSGVSNLLLGSIKKYVKYQERFIQLNDGSELIISIDSSYDNITEIDTTYIRPVHSFKLSSKYISDSPVDILGYSADGSSGEVYTSKYDSKFELAIYKNAVAKIADPEKSSYINDIQLRKERVSEIIEESALQKQVGTFFQSEFEEFDPNNIQGAVIDQNADGQIVLKRPKALSQINTSTARPIKFKSTKIVPYQLEFKLNYVSAQMDNSLIFGGFSPSVGINGNGLQTPGILLMANVIDLFEDHRFTGGIRIPTSFNGMEYFFMYEDLEKRLDKRYVFYRKGSKTILQNDFFPASRSKEISQLIRAEYKWPFDMFRSVRASAAFRNDRIIRLATEQATLEVPIIDRQWLAFRGEYVFDNTLAKSLNILEGSRYKVFAEIQKPFNINSVAGKSSLSRKKILYYLGGVDNWLFPQINSEIPLPNDPDYVYQTLGGGIRGFRTNIRNGHSYALANAEIRLPFFNYILSNRIRSPFLKNFQLVGFFDMGTAWVGNSPFDDDNPLNTSYFNRPTPNIGDPIVRVKVNYFRNPIVYGYGAGIRTILFGYFLKLDYAWGVETGIREDPRFHISLGLDF